MFYLGQILNSLWNCQRCLVGLLSACFLEFGFDHIESLEKNPYKRAERARRDSREAQFPNFTFAKRAENKEVGKANQASRASL